MHGLEAREFRASYQAFIERVHPADRQRVGGTPDGTTRVLHARGAVERAAG